MKNKIICSLVVVFLLSMAVLPASGAIYILKEKEDIDGILNSGYEVKMFFIGRIDDLIIDEQQTSFYPINVFIIAIQKYDETTTSYIGRIKSTSQRFYLSNDYDFKGILTLRFICGGFRYEEHGPDVPSILFTKTDTDEINRLTVVSVDPVDVLWSDIRLLVDGEACNHGNSGTVKAGDIIDLTSIAGTGEYTVSIIHIPTNTLIGVYEFTGAEISITFVQDEENHTLTVVAVIPDNIRWDDLRIEHEGSVIIIIISDDGDGFVDAGEGIFSLYGLVEIFYEPTDTLIGSWEFSEMPPIISFTQDEEDHSLTVVAVIPDDIFWDDIRVEHEGIMTGFQDDGDGIVEAGEMILCVYGHTEIYYKPTNTLIATFEFPQLTPQIIFMQDEEDHMLTVVSIGIYPDDVLWGDLRIEHEGAFIIIGDDFDGVVEVGEIIGNLFGHVEIYYEPTGDIIAEFEFP